MAGKTEADGETGMVLAEHTGILHVEGKVRSSLSSGTDLAAGVLTAGSRVAEPGV